MYGLGSSTIGGTGPLDISTSGQAVKEPERTGDYKAPIDQETDRDGSAGFGVSTLWRSRGLPCGEGTFEARCKFPSWFQTSAFRRQIGWYVPSGWSVSFNSWLSDTSVVKGQPLASRPFFGFRYFGPKNEPRWFLSLP